MVKKTNNIGKGYILVMILLLIFIYNCTSTPSKEIRTKTENDWLLLQNVGYQIEDGNLIWTAGGNFKVNFIKEVRVNQILNSQEKKSLFVFKGTIPKGFFLAKSNVLNKEESKFLKDENDTKMFVEVILVDDQNNTEALYTPVFYSAASKKSVRTILNAMNPNWDK